MKCTNSCLFLMLKSFEASEIRMARGGGRHGRCSNELVASDKQGETISPKMPHDYPRPISPALVSNDNVQIIRRTCMYNLLTCLNLLKF